jgi:hypothetical protein
LPAEESLAPTAFDAVTPIEYWVLLARPVIVHDNGSGSTPTTVEHDAPPGEAVAV